MVDRRQDLHDLGRRLMAEHYPHLPADRFKIVQGEPVHTLWRATTPIGDVCLKRTSIRPSVLEFTTAAHEHLFRNGARVPELLPTARGARFFVHEGHAVALCGWVAGSPLVMDDARPHLRLAVAALARFHAASQGFQPPAGVAAVSVLGRLPERMERAIGELRRGPLDATGQAILHQAEDALRRLRASGYDAWVADAARNGGLLAHRAYHKGNALVVEEGVCILDLEHLAYGLPTEDLRGVILRWMETQGRWSREDLEQILTWYGERFPLDPAQRRALLADLLFPHTYLAAVRRTRRLSDEEDRPDLEALSALEAEKRRVLVE